MEQNGGSIFPVWDALEMVIIFDRTGKITYANDAAEKKLEYEQELCGRNIQIISRLQKAGWKRLIPLGMNCRILWHIAKILPAFP